MEFTYEGIALIPIVTILVNIIKGTGVPTKFLPLISLCIGVVFGILFVGNGDIKNGVLAGIVIGISASGLYSNGREVVNGVRSMRRSRKS
ncbi:holin [Oceanirhabdus sp. W0125-5]|uniref:holin n=1 Tax=Oceanirhabdus sp. W0125-5 TaxID=2999116 RepID=UPI0022F31E2D|nr:holin [Oceanirhabdus sp. W0125-5]WBW95793.1 holin [Oceanirhabdus sp. W0125-5]